MTLGQTVEPGPRVASSWLAPAVVATLCLFPPTGVVAVYFAAQVRPLWAAGDRRAANTAARRARAWTLLSIFLWVVFMAILVATGRLGRLLEAGVV
ncbi:MAG: CD225/dispanin family protein [Candidatus Nanopelagicales bacterium]|nr:CD225/dispanin family protein [Candidatus Nanopelagicales bacterium]